MSNKIEGGQNYTLPSKDRWFFLDENIGMETAFVLASKRTIDDIETVIDSLKNENINKVKKILEKKAGVVKAISFRHIDDKPFQNLRSFDSSLGNALDEASIKSSPYYEKIEAYRDLIQPFLDTARESRNIEKKLVRTFNRVREKHFQDTTRGAGSSVFKKASPAVVIIETDIFEGAGFICNSPDYVITNWHVVEGSEEVFVIYKPSSGIGVKRGNAVVAEVVKVDEVADLALLKIKHPRKNITPLGLGDINQIEPGQDVHAIGHPASQYWTYTRGVVSAIRPNYEWEFSDGSQHKSSVIQTQTPINPGNSGGPLLDDQAKIIGVNCWRLGGEGLNYAISVDEVKKFLRRKESRKTQHLTETMRLAEAIIAEYEAKEIEVLDYDKNGIPEKIRLTFEGVEKITNEIEITANYFVLIQDSDQDGRIDFLGSTLPPNCGIWQDLDSDGYMEVQMIDLDCNGTTDIYGIDENRDGKIDTYF
jgi:S1-C subfamily serine protease